GSLQILLDRCRFPAAVSAVFSVRPGGVPVRCLLGALCLLLGAVTVAESDASVTFTDVTATALPGIADAPGRDATSPQYTGGVTVGGGDGGGLPDLYFTGAGHDVLYRNRGDGTFEDVTVAANLGYTLGTRGAAFADVDNDGDLDIYATGWSNARHFLYIN